MTANDSTRPRAIERWLERSLPGYRFGLVLLFLLLTYACMASGATSSWARVVTVALQGLTLLAALRASQVGQSTFRFAALLALLALVSSVASLGLSPGGTTGVSFALNVLMVAGAPIAIGTAVWRRPVVDVHTVLGAICIYVLVGMLFAFLYGAIGEVGTDPFFVQASGATTADYLYFSFVTLTTVGYGDLTAAGDLGRSLASLEALLGQVYLVTIVATIVSRMSRLRPQRAGDRGGNEDLASPDAS